MILFIAFISMLVLYFVFGKKKGRQDIITVYFGVPGSGKTTFAAFLVKKALKRKENVWSNVPITGSMKYDPIKDLGVNMIEDGTIILDEAGVEFNNRNYKSMPHHVIEFLKYHRHYKTAIDVFSQSHEDMDVTIRRLAQRYYVVKKSLIPRFIVYKAIGRRVGIDENTKQIIDEYFWKPFGTRWLYAPSVWSMFNTVARKELPAKEYEKW